MTPRTLVLWFSLLLAGTIAVACASRTQEIPLGGVAFAPGERALASRGVIPLHENTGGKTGLHVLLSIGGHAAEPLLLDTGSGGLWVYPNAIGTYTKPSSPVAAEYEYHSGLVYNGTVVYAIVKFTDAGLKTASVPVVIVESATCDPGLTSEQLDKCPAHVSAANCPGIKPNQKNAGTLCVEASRKLYGTFGADLEPNPQPNNAPAIDLYNVLFGIAPWATSFVVTPTELDLGPRSTKNFTMLPMKTFAVTSPLPNGAQGWQRDVTLCYTLASSSLKGRAGCRPTVFDTGASGFSLRFPVTAKLRSTTCGKFVKEHLKFTAQVPAGGATLVSFDTGYDENIDSVNVKPSSPPQVNTGLTFYNYYEILFDAKRGLVGLRPLHPAGDLWKTVCSRK